MLKIFVQINNLLKVQAELEKIHLKANKDLKTLGKPSIFAKAYPHILREVNRRKLFNATVRQDISIINTVLKSEIAERKKFISSYGDELPDEFISALEIMPQYISMFKSSK